MTSSATATSATTSEPCIDTFDVVQNVRGNDGNVDTTANSLNKCRNSCLSLRVCVGFTWNGNAKTCNIHTFSADLNDRTADVNADLYVRLDCTVSIPTIPSSSIPECMDDFQYIPNTLAFGGSEQLGANSVPECEELCRANGNCVAFDFTVALRCYLHLSPDSLNPSNVKSDSPNVDQYRRVDCASPGTTGTVTMTPGCQDEFVMVPRMMYFMGTEDPTVNTVEDCTTSCLNQPDCLAFDYNRRNNKCFYFFDSDLLVPENSNSANNIDHYDRIFLCRGTATSLSASTGTGFPSSPAVTSTTVTPVTGTPEPGCTMNRRNNRNAQGGIYAGTMSEDNCRQRCLNDVTCVATDWNKNTNQCYRHVVNTPSSSTNCCIRYEKECDACRDTYVRMANMQAVGGVEVPDAGLESLCAEACTTTPACSAFDFNTVVGKCYLHLTPSLNIIATVGFDHYSFERCFVCYDAYDMYPSSQVLGGQYRPTVGSREECQAMCTTDDICTGYDWNVNKLRCYIHLSDYNSFINNPDVNNYKKIICESTAIPTTTTTTTTARTTTRQRRCQADIVLLVDSSGSIEEAGYGNYQDLKDFLKDFVQSLPISADNVRVALIIFSNYAEVQFDFDDYNTVYDLQVAIDRIPYIGGETFTSHVFRKYLDELLDQDRGNRNDVYDILLLITDGNTTSSDRTLLYNTVNEVTRTNAVSTILGVGIGNIDINEMSKIVTPPFNPNYVNVNEFDQLQENLDLVLLGTDCSGVTIPQPTPVTNTGCALFTFRSTVTESASYPINFQFKDVDYNNNFNLDNDVLTSPAQGIYYFSMSVGAPDRTKVNYGVKAGGRSAVIVRETEYDDGVDTLTKDAIFSMSSGAKATVESAYLTYSDLDKLTSFSAFSISDTMNPLYYFMAGFTFGTQTGPRRVQYKPVVNIDNVFNDNNDYFRVPRNGYYVFSFSAYVQARSVLQMELRAGLEIFELRRDHSNHQDGGDTMSRTVLVYCTAGTQVEVYLETGTIEGRSGYATSFMGFLYEPQDSSAKVAFSISRQSGFENNQLDQATLSLPFTSVDISLGLNIFSTGGTVNEITCTVQGVYFVSLTVVASPGKRVNVYVSLDGLPYMGVYRSSIWHGQFYDTLSRSALLECETGQTLRINIRGDSAVAHSSNQAIYGNNFFGILLYRTY